MNDKLVLPGAELEKPLDIFLADLAIRIQLSETAHRKAVERYESIQRWIKRDGSPLAGLVELFSPQGSMAIGAAIASRVTGDEYDLDVVVQVKLPTGWTPKDVLDALYVAIRGDPGSRYYDMVERRTRCVTVAYADMHLDLTPHERRPHGPEREGDIFHHKEGTLVANLVLGQCTTLTQIDHCEQHARLVDLLHATRLEHLESLEMLDVFGQNAVLHQGRFRRTRRCSIVSQCATTTVFSTDRVGSGQRSGC